MRPLRSVKPVPMVTEAGVPRCNLLFLSVWPIFLPMLIRGPENHCRLSMKVFVWHFLWVFFFSFRNRDVSMMFPVESLLCHSGTLPKKNYGAKNSRKKISRGEANTRNQPVFSSLSLLLPAPAEKWKLSNCLPLNVPYPVDVYRENKGCCVPTKNTGVSYF